MGKKKKQPWGITLNCIVLALGAVIATLGAIAIAILGGTIAWVAVIPIAGLIAALSIFLLLFAIISGVLCIYLWKHNMYAWWIVLILSALGLLSAIFTLPAGLLSCLMSVVLVLGLLHKDTIKAIKPGIKYKGWG